MDVKFGSVRKVGDEEIIKMTSELVDPDYPNDSDAFVDYQWSCRGIDEIDAPSPLPIINIPG